MYRYPRDPREGKGKEKVKMRENLFAKKRKARTIDSRLVGGYLPLPVAERLRLIALYKGSSIQNILQNIIEDWSNKFESDDVIINEVAKLAKEEWKRRRIESIPGDYSLYLEEVVSLLKKRKISEKYIDEIIEILRGWYKE